MDYHKMFECAERLENYKKFIENAKNGNEAALKLIRNILKGAAEAAPLEVIIDLSQTIVAFQELAFNTQKEKN